MEIVEGESISICKQPGILDKRWQHPASTQRSGEKVNVFPKVKVNQLNLNVLVKFLQKLIQTTMILIIKYKFC